MCRSTIFTVLSVLSLSMLVASTPFDKRQTYTGRGTWYYDGLGACGLWNKDSDHIVALSRSMFGPGYPGEHCGQYVSITVGGKTEYAMAHDKCQACGEYDLDMSKGLFEKFDNVDVGVVHVSWHFMPKGWSP